MNALGGDTPEISTWSNNMQSWLWQGFVGMWLPVLSAVVALGADVPRIEYPQTRRGDHIDVYHGVKVPDPYRWLEQDIRQSKEVADWVAAENKVTFAYLAAIPQRDPIRRRLTAMWNYPRTPFPSRKGGATITSRTTACSVSRYFTCSKHSAIRRGC